MGCAGRLPADCKYRKAAINCSDLSGEGLILLILSRVCADFHDRSGKMIFRIRATDRLNLIEAPEAIREDPLFQMLLDDGALEASLNRNRTRELENDPAEGTAADGTRKPDEADQAEAAASGQAEKKAGRTGAEARDGKAARGGKS